MTSRDTASEFEPLPPEPIELPADDAPPSLAALTPPKAPAKRGELDRSESTLHALRVHSSACVQIEHARTSDPNQFLQWSDVLQSGAKLPGAVRKGGLSLRDENAGLVAALTDFDLPQIRARAQLYGRAVDAVLTDSDEFHALRPFGQKQPEPKPAEQPPTPQTPEQIIEAQSLYALGAAKCTCQPEPTIEVTDGVARLTYKHHSTCQQRGYLERVLNVQGIELRD